MAGFLSYHQRHGDTMRKIQNDNEGSMDQRDLVAAAVLGDWIRAADPGVAANYRLDPSLVAESSGSPRAVK